MTDKPFKLGILQCDSVLVQFQPLFGNYPDMLTTLFRQVNPSLDITTYNVEHGEYPKHIDECDGYVTSGSKASVYDNEPWIKQLEEYFRSLHLAKKKVIGICFGHQLIAQALGGKVAPAKQGWGVGVHTNRLITPKNWSTPTQEEFNLVVSHKDQVMELPDEAALIATNDFCPNAAFQIGSHFLTVQGHPEFSKKYAEALMHHRRAVLGDHCYSEGIASLSKPTDHLTFTHWMMNFLLME